MPNRLNPPRRLKAALLLLSLVVSAGLFLGLDWIYSRRVARARTANAQQVPCRVSDPVRDHSLRPNCTYTAHWGADTFEVRTNSLGLRDEEVREVPLVGNRPRILMLGDSFTQSMGSWSDSFVGQIAAHFPQYEFLNGGVASYSPSNYFNTTRLLLAQGVEFDEVIVFIDISDVADEAHVYQDADPQGAVSVRMRSPAAEMQVALWDSPSGQHFLVTNTLYTLLKRTLVSLGFYRFSKSPVSTPFDATRGAWTYKSETEIERAGINSYTPLGVEGGIAKEKAKMTLLWQELNKRNIPISVIVYPWPAQLVHDSVDSRQVRIWREWCEGKCKRFVEVFPAFFAAKDKCPLIQPGCWYSKFFIFGDVHYNRNGNALVANEVIQNLADMPPTRHEDGGNDLRR